MQGVGGRQKTPGFGSPVKLGPKWTLVAVAIVVLVVVLSFLFVITLLQRWGGGGFSNPDDIWTDLQEQQFERYGLLRFYHRAKKINENIDALQKEIDAYTQLHSKLKFNEQGQLLVKDQWIIKYYLGMQGEPLPHKDTAKEKRIELNELMETVIKALAKFEPDTERGHYKVSADTKKAVSLIEYEVNYALYEYPRHRHLLEQVVIAASGEKEIAPQVLDDALKEYLRKKDARTFDHPLVGGHSENEAPRRPSVAEEYPSSPEGGAGSSEESRTLRELRKAQSEAQ